MKDIVSMARLRAACNTILPQSCLDCRIPLTNADSALPYPLCRACLAHLPRITGDCCQRCGIPLISEATFCLKCRTKEQDAVRNRALYLYIGFAQRLIWSYKFSHQKRLAHLFAEQVYQAIENTTGTYAVVPIPGSPKNIRRRGWDQMRVIARTLNKRYQTPILELFDHRRRKAQKSLNRQERMINAASTFTLKPRLKLPSSPQTVILLDDVYTTGSTMTACAQLVRELGIAHIQSVTLCITI